MKYKIIAGIGLVLVVAVLTLLNTSSSDADMYNSAPSAGSGSSADSSMLDSMRR